MSCVCFNYWKQNESTVIFLNFSVVIELIDGQTRGSLVASTISTSQLLRKMVQEAGTLILPIWSLEGHFML